MKISINKLTKKIYVKGSTEGMTVQEYLDNFFSTEDFTEYQIEHEKVIFKYPELAENQTTTAGQSGL